MRARVVIAIALVAIALPVVAERLPVRRYRIVDGLAHEQVRVIRQDSKGYLWIGTGEGVSRFDGYQFVNFGAADGLAVPLINDIALDPDGRVWVATNGSGIARFLDDPAERRPSDGVVEPARFAPFRVGSDTRGNQVNTLVFADGAIWCGTDNGLFRADVKGSQPVFARFGKLEGAIERGLKDSRGRLWFATERDLVQVAGHGVRDIAPLPGRARIAAMGEYEGRVVVASASGVYELTGDVPGGQPAWQLLPLPFRAREAAQTIRSDSQGTLWIGTTAGVIRYRRGQAIRVVVQGSDTDRLIRTVFEDRDRNIWLGTETDGLIRVVSQGIVSFTTADGLPAGDVVALTSGANGVIYAGTRALGWSQILNDSITVMPGSEHAPFNALGRQLKCAPLGSCWALTPAGLYRVAQTPLRFDRADLAHALPPKSQIVTLGGNGLYRDQTGDIWFATTEPALYQIAGNDQPGRVTRIALQIESPMAPMVRDRSGTVWMGNFGGFARLRGSRADVIAPNDGLDRSPRCAFVDSRGRLWIGLRYGGVLMTAAPSADTLDWTRYSTRNGLASDTVWGITEDRLGRVYLATSRGLDQLDPANGQIRHFTTENGLASAYLYDTLTDTQGRIWIASAGGVSRFDPIVETVRQVPPSILVRRVEVGDQVVALPDSGTEDVSGIHAHAGDRMVIHFSGVPLGSQNRIRYRYRLESVDSTWSALTADRTVTYGRLGSGRYRFEVLAVHDVDGTSSARAATVDFTVLPPIWQRWWFLASIAIALLGGVLFTTSRRAARRRATEAFRRQVATDLHDDMGSGLSEIAILGEVLRRQATAPVADGLADIARVARNLRESMSDIVWAIGPGTDHVSDLVDRMRQAAFTMLDFEGLRVEFDAPPADALDRLDMATDRRRHLLLVFKEAVTNVARHARATHLSVNISVTTGELTIVIRDNGVGFDPATVSRGQGLNSLARRAALMRAGLTIDSQPGEGTCVTLTIPLG